MMYAVEIQHSRRYTAHTVLLIIHVYMQVQNKNISLNFQYKSIWGVGYYILVSRLSEKSRNSHHYYVRLFGLWTLGVGLNRSTGLMHSVNFTAHFYEPSLQLDAVIRAQIDPSLGYVLATFNTNIVLHLQAMPPGKTA